MWRLDVSSEAELEVFEGTLRYKCERSGRGFRFEADVNRLFMRLLENPFNVRRLKKALGGRSFRHFPYRVCGSVNSTLSTRPSIVMLLHSS
jgi:hypothetical protein